MLSAQQGLLGPHFHSLSRGRAPSFSKKPSVLSLYPLNPPFPSHLQIRVPDNLHLEKGSAMKTKSETVPLSSQSSDALL